MSKQAKHTPGPWILERHDEDDGSISYEVWNHTADHYGRIASCNDQLTHPNSKANARLIAAAPDQNAALLEVDRLSLVIESAVRYADFPNHAAVLAALNAVTAAIARARGEER